MRNPLWQHFQTFIEKRNPRERVVVIGASVIVIVYLWGMLLFSTLYSANQDLTTRIADARLMASTHESRLMELNALLRDDPDSPLRIRQRELQDANTRADARLEQLYGELIDPRQMAQMLTGILQRETPLVLISLENNAPQMIYGSDVAQEPGQEQAQAQAEESSGTADTPGIQNDQPGDIELFKHGLHMVFTGSFLETVRYLRSLEQLEDNFYWENLEFEVQEYPNARISLDIYTLSTQEEWIGV